MIVLSGDLDIVAVPDLSARIADIARQQPGPLAFDLSQVTFMDCGSARLIVGAGQAAAGRPRRVLVNAPPLVRRLLRVTGLDQLCEVSPEGRPDDSQLI